MISPNWFCMLLTMNHHKAQILNIGYRDTDLDFS